MILSTKKEQYEAHKRRTAQRQAGLAAAGQDIGSLPPIADPVRRHDGSAGLRRFCEIYLQDVFSLAWSPDHLRVIEKIENAVTEGALVALAMPRGSGKSALVRAAALWAVLRGSRRFVAVIGATAEKAAQEIDKIRVVCETNRDLIGDFPEALYPIKCLERITQRQRGQTYRGVHTRIQWLSDRLVFPTIPGSPSSGSILSAAGLESGNIRGQSHSLPSGELLRPDFAFLDDPQTSESAHSPLQSRRREELLAGDVLGMAGPGRKMAAVVCCTVIAEGDMADAILDRKRHPEWQGERTALLPSLPKNMAKWEQYGEIRADGLRTGAGLAPATEFYRRHRAEMDEGAVAAWEARKNRDELSAIQHAMNLRLQNPRAFASEYQNQPEPESLGDEALPTADEICERVNGLPRGVASPAAQKLTAFVDIQQKLLYWIVVAWDLKFGGTVLDYGSYPDQNRSYFTLADARRTLAHACPKAALEGQIYDGLQTLVDSLLGRAWKREDGAELRIERLMIDANWSQSTDSVYQFCRASPHAALLLPSHGRFVGAASKPMDQYEKRPGEQVGLNWRIGMNAGKRKIRHVIFDANFWKTTLFNRISAAVGDRGALTLWGKDPESHRLLATHLTAEYRIRTSGRGRTVDEWRLRPERPDNHWLDGLVGCAVAASILGIAAGAEDNSPARKVVSVPSHMRVGRAF